MRPFRITLDLPPGVQLTVTRASGAGKNDTTDDSRGPATSAVWTGPAERSRHQTIQ